MSFIQRVTNKNFLRFKQKYGLKIILFEYSLHQDFSFQHFKPILSKNKVIIHNKRIFVDLTKIFLTKIVLKRNFFNVYAIDV